ncbi:insulinase family protein [Opitutales bacterium]|nr:insulinase family protein [Opitutales bacterium]
MKSTLHRTMGRFLALSLLTSCSPTGKPDTASSQTNQSSMQVLQKTLDNGLTVYLSPNAEEPRFYAEIITRAGSKHDPSTNTGLAHYLEHLLFKGTRSFGTENFAEEEPLLRQISELYEQRAAEKNGTKRDEIYRQINTLSTEASKLAIPNEMDRVYSDMGAKGLNAHTWHEETVYKIDLPANRLEHWAKIESERFAQPVFRLFHTELETVYEEKNRAIDNKHRLIYRAVNNLLFKVHPYGQQSTLGTVEHLKNPSIYAIEEFYSKHYVPQNMAICLSGDLDPEPTFAIIEKYFGKWSGPEELRPEPSWNEKPLEGREFVEVEYLGEEHVVLAFRTAPKHHKDYPALRLVDMILDNSVAGLINLDLVEKQKVRAAGCYPQNLNDFGAHYLYGTPKDGQSLETVEQLLLQQIERVKKGDFEDWALQAVINDFKKRQKENYEKNDQRVELLRDTFLAFVDWNVTLNEISEMERVTKADIIRVANKYYGKDYVAGFRIDAQHDLPSIEKPAIDPLSIDPDKGSSFMEEVDQLPYEPLQPKFLVPEKDFSVREISPGIRLIHTFNPLNDLFNLEVRMDLGFDHQPMLSTAKRMLDRAGARKMSSEDLKVEWYKLGTDFGFGVQEHFCNFFINGLDENFLSSLQLAESHLLFPNSSEEIWNETKDIILSERDDEQKDPNALTHALAHFHRYGKNSRYLKRSSDTDLNNSTTSGLSELLKQAVESPRSILYFGPQSPDVVEQWIRDSFLGVSPKHKAAKVEPDRSLKTQKDQVYFLHKEMAQAQVRFEFSSGLLDESLTPSVQIFNEYFGGGMAGLVFQELREARALAYSAWARFFTPSRPDEENVMVGSIGCQADKTIDAMEAFIGLLKEMPVSNTRWSSAHASLLSAYRTNPITSRAIPKFVYDVDTLGLKIDPRESRFKNLSKAKIDGFEKFYQDKIKAKSILFSVVGDSTRIDMEALEKFGPFTQVSAKELFRR